MGAACPVACNTAIATQWFKINTDATKTCLSRPGNSGENSMRSGSCHSTSMYSYSQWITCDCSGGETVKDAKSDGCYIDNPTSLCSRAVDMVKFHWLHDHQLRYSDRSDGVWFCRRRAHLRHCLEYLLQYWLHRTLPPWPAKPQDRGPPSPAVSMHLARSQPTAKVISLGQVVITISMNALSFVPPGFAANRRTLSVKKQANGPPHLVARRLRVQLIITRVQFFTTLRRPLCQFCQLPLLWSLVLDGSMFQHDTIDKHEYVRPYRGAMDPYIKVLIKPTRSSKSTTLIRQLNRRDLESTYWRSL